MSVEMVKFSWSFSKGHLKIDFFLSCFYYCVLVYSFCLSGSMTSSIFIYTTIILLYCFRHTIVFVQVMYFDFELEVLQIKNISIYETLISLSIKI